MLTIERNLSHEFTPALDGNRVLVCGWVHSRRDLGKIIFLSLRDRKGFIQISIPQTKVSEEVFQRAKTINLEDVLRIEGIAKKHTEAPSGVEIIPEKFETLTKAIPKLPLDVQGKVPAELPTRLNHRVLDLRTSRQYKIFEIASELQKNFRNVFYKEDFIEINTPKIIAAGTEGGTELFSVNYFDRVAYLAQSPQLYKEQMCAVFERVFEIAPIWRAEAHRTGRHVSESIMLDFEMAFDDMFGVMRVAERLLAEGVSKTMETCSHLLEPFDVEFTEISTPFPRYTYTEIIDKLQNLGIEIPWGEDISTEAYRKLGETLKGPYWITHWPLASKPFYISPSPDDPKLSESFDLQWGWLELASGGTRVHQKEILIERLRAQGLDPEQYSFHTDCFDWGMPPHAGLGFGVARSIMVLLGISNIRECILYPRDIDRLVP